MRKHWFTLLTIIGVLLLLLTLALTVWMQEFEPYQRQQRVWAQLQKKLEGRATISDQDLTSLPDDLPWYISCWVSWYPGKLPDRDVELDNVKIKGKISATLDESDLVLLSRLPFAKRIYFVNAAFTENALADFMKRFQGNYVQINRSHLTHADIAGIPPSRKMTYLILYIDVGLSDQALADWIAKYPNLEYLRICFWVEGSPVGDKTRSPVGSKTCKAIAGCKKLTTLELSNHRGISDADLESWKGLTELKKLELNGSSITGKGLAALKEIRSLETLCLNRCAVDDASLEHLKELKNLVGLEFSETPITNAGLEHLRELPKLKRLELNGTAITDAGMDVLETFPTLRYIEVNDAKITKKRLAEFRTKRMPP